MPASRDKVIRSPRLAAMGVATLSGLMPTFLDATITPIMMRPVEFRVRPVRARKTLLFSSPTNQPIKGLCQTDNTTNMNNQYTPTDNKHAIIMILGGNGRKEVPAITVLGGRTVFSITVEACWIPLLCKIVSI